MNIKNIPRYIQLVVRGKPREVLGFRFVTALAKLIVPTYRFTWPELAWFQNTRLRSVLTRFGEAQGFNAHRRFALQQLLRLTANVPGDTAECGAYRGCGSFIILEASKQSTFSRVHHIFDSFEGLSSPAKKDGTYWTANDLSIAEGIVRENLSDFTDVNFYKGWIPTRFGDVDDRMFSFVHVDVDLYEPTLDSIRFFYDKLSAGAIFVCDDFGFDTCPGATAAVLEFLQSKPEKMVSLPGGGGFFIKGCVTAPE